MYHEPACATEQQGCWKALRSFKSFLADTQVQDAKASTVSLICTLHSPPPQLRPSTWQSRMQEPQPPPSGCTINCVQSKSADGLDSVPGCTHLAPRVCCTWYSNHSALTCFERQTAASSCCRADGGITWHLAHQPACPLLYIVRVWQRRHIRLLLHHVPVRFMQNAAASGERSHKQTGQSLQSGGRCLPEHPLIHLQVVLHVLEGCRPHLELQLPYVRL